jgi:hypothetical protein
MGRSLPGARARARRGARLDRRAAARCHEVAARRAGAMSCRVHASASAMVMRSRATGLPRGISRSKTHGRAKLGRGTRRRDGLQARPTESNSKPEPRDQPEPSLEDSLRLGVAKRDQGPEIRDQGSGSREQGFVTGEPATRAFARRIAQTRRPQTRNPKPRPSTPNPRSVFVWFLLYASRLSRRRDSATFPLPPGVLGGGCATVAQW